MVGPWGRWCREAAGSWLAQREQWVEGGDQPPTAHWTQLAVHTALRHPAGAAAPLHRPEADHSTHPALPCPALPCPTLPPTTPHLHGAIQHAQLLHLTGQQQVGNGGLGLTSHKTALAQPHAVDCLLAARGRDSAG